ncbi:MAG: DMT family transporter [Bythopirellula sp.]
MIPRQALHTALFAVLLFASAPTCVRSVHLDAIALGLCRLGLASLGMTVFLGFRWSDTRKSVQPCSWRTTYALLLLGLTFGVHWLAFFLSIKVASAAIGTIGFSTYGLWLIVLGWLLGRGQVTRFDLLGLVLACVGTWLLIPEFSFQNEYTLGLMIGIFSGLTAAVLPIMHQHYADIDGNLRAWGQFTFAMLVFAASQPWAKWEVQAGDVPLILYLGLGIALVGHGLWVHAVTALSTTTTSILSYLYLPISLIMGFVFLGEKLAGRALAGTSLVLIANALVLVSQHRRGTLGSRGTTS